MPETIRSLIDAEIRVWMLTGDKRETAINIGHASGLITPETRQLKLATQGFDFTLSRLNTLVEEVFYQNTSNQLTWALFVDGAVSDFPNWFFAGLRVEINFFGFCQMHFVLF